MPDNHTPLSEDERLELERLRAEKQQRMQAKTAEQHRLELERLRREKAQAELDAQADERDAKRRQRAREYMEPDEDLKMPLAQKVVLLFVAILIAWFVVFVVGGNKGLLTG